MEETRFDRLVKAIATGTSRRTMLKGVIGVGGASLASGAGLLRLDPSMAAADNVPVCHWDGTLGAFKLISVSSDAVPAHERHGDIANPDFSSLTTCGDCNTSCSAPSNGQATCTAGACAITCNPGYVPNAAGTGCVVDCSPECPEGYTCCDNLECCDGECCEEDCCFSPQVCCGNTCCDLGEDCCDGVCYPTNTQTCCNDEIIDGSCCVDADCPSGMSCCDHQCCDDCCQGACCLSPDVCCGDTCCSYPGEACCASTCYDTKIQTCCDGVIVDAHCCTEAQCPPNYVCCEGDCCDDCCNGECCLAPDFCCGDDCCSPINQDCCGDVCYDIFLQSCCNGAVVDGLVCP